jgi:putative ABC transport system ATP-binding protein
MSVMNHNEMIKVDGLEFSYPDGEFYLSVPELTVYEGEKIAVIGPSGAGKSTLLNLLAGVSRPAEGRVHVNGQDVSAMNDNASRKFRSQSIGFVLQDFGLLDYLNAGENILYSYRICSSLRLDDQVRDRALALAGRLDVSDRLHRRPGSLSQGERQRVAICRALLHKPPLILADEPTGNLDPINKQIIIDLLFDAVAANGATLMAVTHDHELLSSFDRIIDFRDFTAGKSQ